MNKVKALAICLAFLAVMACGGGSKEISVRKGSFISCPDCTIEEVVSAFIEKPKWKHFVGENGIDYVSANGVTASGKPLNVVITFWIRNNDSLGIEAFEIDKESLDNMLQLEVLIKQMCEAAKIKKEEEKFSKASVAPAEPLKDSRNSNKYKTVKIGEQIWMAENLNYAVEGSKCGGTVPKTKIDTIFFDAETITYYSLEDKNTKNCDKYGRLYDWKTAMKACPSGWHLPKKAEWDKLIATTGGEDKAGKYLKAKKGWKDNEGTSGNGLDTYGFSALPGSVGQDGEFASGGSDDFGTGHVGLWWSASEHNSDFAYYLSIYKSSEAIYWSEYDVEIHRGYNNKSNLFSVRCVKD